ncbi:MAG: hypothetical protein KC478_06015 [Bacteriovoracaceae bacterium]|nr:hypothetical protein [Bacteriovoracaceae bacterium]
MKAIIVLSFVYSVCLGAAEINPFSTDGCSAYLDGVKTSSKKLWYHCCFTHDVSYWIGGSNSQRKEADRELESCVAEVTHPAHAAMMYFAVRVGGKPDSGLPWRWAYGFDQDRGYTIPNRQEKQTILGLFDDIFSLVERNDEGLSQKQLKYIKETTTNIKSNLKLNRP